MPLSLTHQYIPRIEQTEENLFMEEYYSSTDTKIYIDDLEQSEVSYINYSVQEQLKPIYGYSSHTFDDVAIGNRIITGMLKLAIKNREVNSTENEILERSLSEYDSYNTTQEEEASNIDWIGNSYGDVTLNIQNENIDALDEYITKLINLGYDLDFNSSVEAVTNIIKQVQEENNLDVNGLLTEMTKTVIDNMLNTSNLETIQVPANTKFYLKPTHTSDYETFKTAQTVRILDAEWEDGWIYVMTEDGREGFINEYEL